MEAQTASKSRQFWAATTEVEQEREFGQLEALQKTNSSRLRAPRAPAELAGARGVES